MNSHILDEKLYSNLLDKIDKIKKNAQRMGENGEIDGIRRAIDIIFSKISKQNAIARDYEELTPKQLNEKADNLKSLIDESNSEYEKDLLSNESRELESKAIQKSEDGNRTTDTNHELFSTITNFIDSAKDEHQEAIQLLINEDFWHKANLYLGENGVAAINKQLNQTLSSNPELYSDISASNTYPNMEKEVSDYIEFDGYLSDYTTKPNFLASHFNSELRQADSPDDFSRIGREFARTVYYLENNEGLIKGNQTFEDAMLSVIKNNYISSEGNIDNKISFMLGVKQVIEEKSETKNILSNNFPEMRNSMATIDATNILLQCEINKAGQNK